ncbi:MAG: TonB-dependent receptor [bacterium]
MKQIWIGFILLCLSSAPTFSQVPISGKVIDEDGDPVIGALVKFTSSEKVVAAVKSNKKGEFQTTLSKGEYSVTINYVGFEAFKKELEVPAGDAKEITLDIHLRQEHFQDGEVVISATRTARNIADVPIRVEVIPADDLQESITMGLSSAKAVLSELPGIVSQTTSAATGAATLRIHGLDGRYTQLLVDGIPAFGGLNMNFSILQLPPLNLRQLEIIKGSAAGIHGADAIGGIINFLTKIPTTDVPSAQAIVNVTNLGGTDLAGYYSQKFDELGITIHTTYNNQQRRDIDKDGFADLPMQERIAINPKITYSFSPSSELVIAPAYSHEKRFGGFMAAPVNYEYGSKDIFSNATTTERIDLLGSFSQKFDQNNSAVLNSALIHTQRNSYLQQTPFDGTETIVYNDIQWSGDFLPLRLLGGLSYSSEKFVEDSIRQFDRSFTYSDLGIFGQGEYQFSSIVTALASIRADLHNFFGTVISPRASLMIRPSKDFTLRLSGGTGWRAPNIFDEDAESHGFRGVPPITSTEKERSESFSLEGKYQFLIGEWNGSTDINLFQTTIHNQQGINVFTSAGNDSEVVRWQTIGDLSSKGMELIAQAHGNGLDLFFGYTYAFVRQIFNGVSSTKEFTPQHFINASILWQSPSVLRLVSDFSYESAQLLPANSFAKESPSVFTIGASAEVWITNSLSIFLNVENALDSRQTKTMPLYLGTPGKSTFNPNFVWGPVEGRAINAGVKIKL